LYFIIYSFCVYGNVFKLVPKKDLSLLEAVHFIYIYGLWNTIRNELYFYYEVFLVFFLTVWGTLLEKILF
jgi:hypothetical protein